MYYISDFCHICLQYEKSLINVMQDESENAEIVLKLSLCVSEVEWSSHRNLHMCKSCVQKLNLAYDFKQQCIRSTDAITKYLDELSNEAESKLVKAKLNVELSTKDVSKELLDDYVQSSGEETKMTGFIHIVPDQKLFSPLTKLIVTNSGQGPFQNIYLNLIPTSMLNLNKNISQPTSLKESTQNMFIMGNINNTVAFSTNSIKPQVTNNNLSDIDVSHILDCSKTEELSVDVDPTVFDCMTDEECEGQENTDSNEKDWDEIISCNKISHVNSPPKNLLSSNLTAFPTVQETVIDINSYLPILPKINNGYNSDITNEEKMEFFHFGHFLTNPEKSPTKLYNMNMQCDICSECFDTIRSLHHHIKQVHNGNFPYKCGSCLAEFALRSHYETHMQKHNVDNSDTLLGNSITLDNINSQSSECFLSPENFEFARTNKEYKCSMCSRKFTTSQGLIRHKVRRHDEQRARPKYFVKGMKNAKCNICNRSFSTQSYLQLHLKLHNRKGEWKRKIYNKEDVKETADKVSENEEVKETEEESVDKKEDVADVAIDDVNENSTPVTDTVNNNPCEPNRSLKIKINLKDIPKIQESIDEETNSLEQMEESEDADIIPENYVETSADTSDENNVPEQYNMAHFDELSVLDTNDPQESKLDALSLSDDTLNLQNQNTNVFKCKWVNGKPTCVYCYKMFGRKHDLKRHINNVHMKSIQYKCHICKRKFYEGFHLTRHLRGHYSSLACPQCNKKFCTITEIKNHLIVSHDAIGNIDCGVCNISFDDLVILKDHVEEHFKTIIYKCHICDDEYKECRDLTKHIVEHSGVYTCNQCNRNFCTEKELVSHLRIHSSEVSMRHRCDICQNTFKKKRYLYSHLKNCHAIEKHDAESLIDRVTCEYSNQS